MNTARHTLTGQRTSLLASFTTLLKIAPLALALLFTACSHQGAALPGTWQRVETLPYGAKAVTEFTFVKDGTFHGHIDIEGKGSWSFAGKWEIQGNWLQYTFTESNAPSIAVGQTSKDHLIGVSATTLKLESDGGLEVYERRS